MIAPDIHICSYIVIQQDLFDAESFDMEISKSKKDFNYNIHFDIRQAEKYLFELRAQLESAKGFK